MVYPIVLYPPETEEFVGNGLGSLGEAMQCVVTEEANGSFELELVYPMHGRRFNDIKNRSIIYAKPNPVDPPQAFRIYEISKPINGIVTYYAAHISYDLAGYPVKAFTANSCSSAMAGLNENSVIKPNPFTFSTDKESTAKFSLNTPMPTRNALGGVEGSILDVYGGEYKFDNFKVKLCNQRGSDRGVTIRYGKNLTDFKQEENVSNVYTDVYPYWAGTVDNEEVVVTLPEGTIPAKGTYNFKNVLVLDLTSEFQERPFVTDLREMAQEYVKNHDIGVPKVSITVSFEQLEQSEEFLDITLFERVELFDTVGVEFPEAGVSASAKVSKTEYDVLTGKYTSVTIGSVRANISDSIIGQDNAIETANEQNKSRMQKAIENATRWITNGRGYMVAVKNEAGEWMEICSLDTPDIQQAINVWRWNNGGFGHSSHGYGGPYDLAITQDGQIVADFITTGTLDANLLRAGRIQDVDGYNFWDLETGEFNLSSSLLKFDSTSFSEFLEGQIGENINDFITSVYDPEISKLQEQIDGQIETFFYDYAPSLYNAPANGWTTDAERQKHAGDLFFNRSTGYSYRFTKSGGSWSWTLIRDTGITTAIQNASVAKDTADRKRRVFISTPYTPYDAGDLWVQGPNGGIYRCIASRSSGAYYSSDWGLASNYIDKSVADTSASTAVNNQTQEFIFNKLTNNKAVQGLTMLNGQLYINASYINSGTLSGTYIKGGYLLIGDTESDYVQINKNAYYLYTSYRNVDYGGTLCGSIIPGYDTMNFPFTDASGNQVLTNDRVAGININSNYVFLVKTRGQELIHGEPNYVRVNGSLYSSNLRATSTLSKISQTPSYGTRSTYSYETTSPMSGDIGSGETDETGECYVYFDPIFAETISEKVEYQVFLQKEGPGDLWVGEKKPEYFVVKGTEKLKFSWEVKSKQADQAYARLENPSNDLPVISAESLEYEYEEEIKGLIDEREDY